MAYLHNGSQIMWYIRGVTIPMFSKKMKSYGSLQN